MLIIYPDDPGWFNPIIIGIVNGNIFVNNGTLCVLWSPHVPGYLKNSGKLKWDAEEESIPTICRTYICLVLYSAMQLSIVSTWVLFLKKKLSVPGFY